MSEHAYGELNSPETALPARMKEVRDLLRTAGAEKPIWCTEQGAGADDDGLLRVPDDGSRRGPSTRATW